MDLFSTVVQLRAKQSIHPYGFAGRQVQAWLLREIRRKHPAVANYLHAEEGAAGDAGPVLRPYTVSTVYKGPHPAWSLEEGDWCWVRVTALNSELSELLSGEVLPDLLPEARLGPVEFDVCPWGGGGLDDPRCQVDTYTGLLESSLSSQDQRPALDFLSPTSFKSGRNRSGQEMDIPLPVPGLVFGSYLKNWNAFAHETMPGEAAEFIDDCLAVNEAKVKTERVQLAFRDSSRSATGFVGQVRFAILGNRKITRYGSDWQHYATITRALARYAYFCGTGHRTTVGLGQTRMISNPSS